MVFDIWLYGPIFAAFLSFRRWNRCGLLSVSLWTSCSERRLSQRWEAPTLISALSASPRSTWAKRWGEDNPQSEIGPLDSSNTCTLVACGWPCCVCVFVRVQPLRVNGVKVYKENVDKRQVIMDLQIRYMVNSAHLQPLSSSWPGFFHHKEPPVPCCALAVVVLTLLTQIILCNFTCSPVMNLELLTCLFFNSLFIQFCRKHRDWRRHQKILLQSRNQKHPGTFAMAFLAGFWLFVFLLEKEKNWVLNRCKDLRRIPKKWIRATMASSLMTFWDLGQWI